MISVDAAAQFVDERWRNQISISCRYRVIDFRLRKWTQQRRTCGGGRILDSAILICEPHVSVLRGSNVLIKAKIRLIAFDRCGEVGREVIRGGSRDAVVGQRKQVLEHLLRKRRD